MKVIDLKKIAAERELAAVKKEIENIEKQLLDDSLTLDYVTVVNLKASILSRKAEAKRLENKIKRL